MNRIFSRNGETKRWMMAGQLPVVAGLMVLLTSTSEMPAATNQRAQPNVLIIMADDCTFSDLPAYGGQNALTPNLDRLAKQSLVFDRAYLCSAMCQPCRAELFTGLYPMRNGCAWNHSASRPGMQSLPHLLGDLGYRVGLAGKVHVAPKSVFPFQAVGGFDKNCVRNPTQQHELDDIRRFMTGPGDQPFCLVVALVEPHVPWVMGDASQYPQEQIKLPPNIADTPGTREAFSRYLAEISYMDEQVGELLQTLEMTGKSQDTLVLFTSEQGAQFPGCKWTNWDTGVHTALFARWPGNISSNSRTKALVQYADVAPTLYELAGGDIAPGQFDGTSFAPVLFEETDQHRDVVYGMHNNVPEGPAYPIRSVCDGEFHYIQNLTPDELYIEKHLMGLKGDGLLNNPYWGTWVWGTQADERTYQLVKRYQMRPAEELYRLTVDPFEMENLSGKAEFSDVQASLSEKLGEWMQQQGDPGIEQDTPSSHRAAKQGKHRFVPPKVKPVAFQQKEVNRPNIVLMMADDQGWGETGYYGHPVLKTPNLDAMAANGLRFDRFYAAAPVCSPTRASVLTGRSNRRSGVDSHGFALRRQEKTLSQALLDAGYLTAHFGKWHLNGIRGPGVPILADDSHHPGNFGFEHWLSVTNFFDRDPILSREGQFEEFSGDSSEIVVDQALNFISEQQDRAQPFFIVIWFGTPHSPFRAADADMQEFVDLDESSRKHYGELVALDRAVGTFRVGLRDLDVADNTIFWYCSDNGGLPRINPSTVGALRGFKGSLYEGGLRVPAIVEWPLEISGGRISEFPASTMDIFPTLADIVGLSNDTMLEPQDGMSLVSVFENKEPSSRGKPISFSCLGNSAFVDNDVKLILLKAKNEASQPRYELYNLKDDPAETNNLYEQNTSLAESMRVALDDWLSSLNRSIEGQDYPEKRVNSDEPQPRFWMDMPAYQPYFKSWRQRPEYAGRLKNR